MSQSTTRRSRASIGDARGTPRDPHLESTWAWLRDPYGFVRATCRQLGSHLFEARFALRPTTFLAGPDAGRLFYDERRFARAGAMPEPVRATLVGTGGVQGLDGAPHRHRKALFMGLMTPERVRELGALTAGEWERAARRWEGMRRVVLYRELHPVLTRAVCAWAGVPLVPGEVRRRTRHLTLMFDRAGAVGPGHLRARVARRCAERWAARLVVAVRAGRLSAPEESALRRIAEFRDLDGRRLAPGVAAVELLNVLRPTVAISVYIVHLAHALHTQAGARERVRGDADDAARFIDEVRRWYPFFPAQVARVREGFDWAGHPLPRGRQVVLDLHATNRDARTWSDPDRFDPDRFARGEGGPFAFVPQGGGDAHVTHRCPGEAITVELMLVALGFLTRRLAYTLPDQDLRVDCARLPALPRSRIVMRDVRLA